MKELKGFNERNLENIAKSSWICYISVEEMLNRLYGRIIIHGLTREHMRKIS